MDRQSKFPKTSIIIAIVILTTALSCKFLSGSSTPTVSTDQPNPPGEPQLIIPPGWKWSTDASGQCQVAAPPDWTLGEDFFLGAGRVDPGPFNSYQGKFPPSGEELWKDHPGLQGHYFQDRRTKKNGDLVCSVWRIQADVDFSEEQVHELEEVGKNLREVKK